MAQLMLINPRKRRAKRKAAPAKRRVAVRSNPVPPIKRRRSRRTSLKTVARRSRRIRRNPIGLNGIMGTLTDAAIGAGGAIAVNFAFDKLPLPLSMKSGMVGVASKAALAIALGTFGKKFMGNTAGKMAAGALTVIAYDLAKQLLPLGAPAVVSNTAGLGYAASGQGAGYLGEYVNGGDFNFATSGAGMGEYVGAGYNY